MATREEEIAALRREIDELDLRIKKDRLARLEGEQSYAPRPPAKTPEQQAADAAAVKEQRDTELRARLAALRSSPLGPHATDGERAERALEVERIWRQLGNFTERDPSGHDPAVLRHQGMSPGLEEQVRREREACEAMRREQPRLLDDDEVA